MNGEGDRSRPILPFLPPSRPGRNPPKRPFCDARTFLADRGCPDRIEHRGDSAACLKKLAPNDRGAGRFVERQAVTSENFIAADGTSAVGFAREIPRPLGVRGEKELDDGSGTFKGGFYGQ